MPTPLSSAPDVARPQPTVRRQFLDFFAARGHEVVPSASLVPPNDPTLLFTNAGMVPVQGRVHRAGRARPTRARPRSQKCVRVGGKHNDLENVGAPRATTRSSRCSATSPSATTSRRTRSPSPGSSSPRVYGIDPTRAGRTPVHHVATTRRARSGRRSPASATTASSASATRTTSGRWARPARAARAPRSTSTRATTSPCAEVAAGRPCQGPACDCDRWLEIWNLVFMQFERARAATRRPAARPSVDTGVGLERLCARAAGRALELRHRSAAPARRPRRASCRARPTRRPTTQDDDVSMRVIADHARATAFLIADGVFPDKTGREYVLRRIMRRAIRHGRRLGHREAVPARGRGRRHRRDGRRLPGARASGASVIAKVAERGGGALPRDARARPRDPRRASSRSRGRGPRPSPATIAFKLYDTFGFPLDLTRVIAERARASPSTRPASRRRMDEQRARAASSQGSGEVAVEARVPEASPSASAPTTFTGYEATRRRRRRSSRCVADGAEVDGVGPARGGSRSSPRETPFYGESGGQVGDAGTRHRRRQGAAARRRHARSP